MRRIVLLIFFMIAIPEAARAVEAQSLIVNRPEDLVKSCHQLSVEASIMRDIIHATQDIRNTASVQKKGVRLAGGIGSLLIGTATGGIGFAAAGLILTDEIDDQSADIETVQDKARQRRGFLIGLFNAHGCAGPIEHVMRDHGVTPAESVSYDAIEPAGGGSDRITQQQRKYNQ